MSDNSSYALNFRALQTADWNITAIFSLAIAVNAAMVILMSMGLTVPTIAFTVLVVFINLMPILGINSSIDDMRATLQDLSEEERKMNRYKNWLNAPFIMYRVIIIVGFGGTGAGLLFALFAG